MTQTDLHDAASLESFESYLETPEGRLGPLVQHGDAPTADQPTKAHVIALQAQVRRLMERCQRMLELTLAIDWASGYVTPEQLRAIIGDPATVDRIVKMGLRIQRANLGVGGNQADQAQKLRQRMAAMPGHVEGQDEYGLEPRESAAGPHLVDDPALSARDAAPLIQTGQGDFVNRTFGRDLADSKTALTLGNNDTWA